MHVIQEIGAYAGLAAMVGLAVLSALYFSQARDVKRLREWAGRAPERAAERAGRAVAPIRPGQPPPKGAPRPAAHAAPTSGQRPPPGPGAPAAAPSGTASSGGGGASGPAAPPPAAATGATPAAATAAAEQGGGAATAPGEAPAAPATNDSKGGGDPVQKAPPPGTAPAVAIPAVEQAPPSSNARPAAPPGRPPAAGGAAPPRTAGRVGGSRATTSRPFSRAPAEPWYRRVLRGRPEYLVLAVTGVLIIGGALAFAVSQVGGAHSSSTHSNAASGSGRAAHQPPLSPHDVTVSVLNGTTVPGLAAQVGDRVQSEGFRLGNITNGSNQQRGQSVVLYAPGASRQAVLVSRRLGIAGRQAMDAESQALGGSAKVVVVVGRDETP
jgi:LytR cell envelope-related transcriptional attenuator